MHPLWFYKHQHDNRVRSKLFVAWQRWRFQCRFWFIPSVPGYMGEEEEHKPDPWPNTIEKNHMVLHLQNEYDKLLKPRQLFRITCIRILRRGNPTSRRTLHISYSQSGAFHLLKIFKVTSGGGKNHIWRQNMSILAYTTLLLLLLITAG